MFGRQAILLLLCLYQAACCQADGARMALVIGNDRYQNVGKLKNAVSDARAMAEALTQAGFDVAFKSDTDLAGLKQAVR